MTSPHDEQAILLYAHGELQGLERSRVELHLRSCAACRRRWEAFRADAGAIRQALNTPLPEANASRLAAAIATRIRETPQETPPAAAALPRGLRSRGWLPATVVLALLLLLVAAAAVVVLQHHPLGIGRAASNNPADCGRPPGVQNTPPASSILHPGNAPEKPAP